MQLAPPNTGTADQSKTKHMKRQQIHSKANCNLQGMMQVRCQKAHLGRDREEREESADFGPPPFTEREVEARALLMGASSMTVAEAKETMDGVGDPEPDPSDDSDGSSTIDSVISSDALSSRSSSSSSNSSRTREDPAPDSGDAEPEPDDSERGELATDSACCCSDRKARPCGRLRLDALRGEESLSCEGVAGVLGATETGDAFGSSARLDRDCNNGVA